MIRSASEPRTPSVPAAASTRQAARELAPPEEVRLLVNDERSIPTSVPVASGEAVLFSARSPDKLTVNEDAAALIPIDAASCVLVVADGLGGERAGQEASSLAVKTIARIVREAAEQGGESLRAAILDAIETANEAILQLGLGAATTLAVAEITDGEVRPYHVGDSMILVTGGLGKIKLLTVSHAPVAMAVESGMMDEHEAMHHEHRHLVSNVVGSDSMRIEIGTKLKLAPRDTLILASDGLSDNLHTGEIVARIRKGPLEKSVTGLIDDVHERMREPADGIPHKPDDLTLIAFRLARSRSKSKKGAGSGRSRRKAGTAGPEQGIQQNGAGNRTLPVGSAAT
jgi:PPM family protein phosphatase